MKMGNLGWLIMLVCFISFTQWHDQDSAAQESPQGRTDFFLEAKAAAESSPSPLTTTSNKLKFEYRKQDDSALCMQQGECTGLGDCSYGCYCGEVLRCTQSEDVPIDDYAENFCRSHRCSTDPNSNYNKCPDFCSCGIYMCAPLH